MYLKRIVLHGFKSFADRTEFEFGRGRTSIVGPNGCGKSNVLDAVRWVLGEQSAKTLRGTKMLDVIFAGSRTRKPANAAEVSLIFDNSSGFLSSDADEVVVTRTLYSSGESEYRINGNACRLKDIRDLFLDTGVGVDAYSFIEQGKVDSLLQASPIERREIFEEAAGISRYKVRRTEAQRKLERTQQNLLRLNDVLEELERRLRSVKLAAGKARNFQEYDARLRELRSSFSLAELYGLRQNLQAVRAQEQSLSDVLQARRVDLAARDADAAELSHRLQGLDEQVRSAEERLAAFQTESSALNERIAQGRRRVVELGESQARMAEQARADAQRAAELDQRIAAAQAEVENLRQAEARCQEAVEALRGRRDEADRQCQAGRQALESERRAAFETARQASLLGSELAAIEEQSRRYQQQMTHLSTRRDEAAQRRAVLEGRGQEIAQRTAELDRQAERLRTTLAELDARLAELEQQREALAAQITRSKESRSAVRGRVELLAEMERRHEGLGQATRWVLEWPPERRQAASVVGLVADVLRFEDERAWLLAPLVARIEQQLVVRNSRSLLSAMSEAGDPPAALNIVALDRLVARASGPDYSESPGCIARAIDWVRCEAEFRPLAEHLLGRVIVVDQRERALALAAAAPDGFVFVSLDGCLAGSGGELIIGTSRETGGLIQRKAELRQLQAELDELEAQLQGLQREAVAADAAVEEATLQRSSRLEELAGLQRQHADARHEQARVADDLSRTGREISTIESELAEIGRALQELAARAERSRAAQAARAASQSEHEQRISSLEQSLAELERAYSALVGEQTTAMVEVGRLAERREAAERAAAELAGSRQRLLEQSEQAARASGEAAERIAAAEQELRESAARLAELSRLSAEQEAAALGLREQRQSQRRHLEACNATVRRLHGEIEEIDGVLRERQVERREIEVRSENLVTRCREELGVDLAALLEEYRHAEQDWDAVRSEIEELRQKIARLGNVNLDAIAELEELTPRYENLAAQRDDLVESISRLETLIAELDEESRRRFLAAFEEIRGHFQELFRKVFGGGKADMILESPENPLECGIEIIARPPGKEPQSLSLLSGGEKTMTAVALLLAVFKSKPSPFAIMDEVDAALDEANIDRFNSVLNEFLVHSQFIVITHSKKTMQYGDVLYGVTMEEPGVSKRVSVRLTDGVEAPLGA